MDFNKVRESVKKLVTEIIAMDTEGETKGITIEYDDSLIDSGLIDSIGAVQLIEACSLEFDIIVHPAELSIENFDSINKIAKFIQLKLDGQD
ncbi:MAG: phosphopantetheine-binding protein [Nitrospirota bacterium]|nr:phosphopantetheine-binding protein [Nitrospirota bacterium]MDH5768614.1 phosphopantetheine-binding protein [Nitrospirota bacterium]